ncbi:MAG: 50S ribosomal protein L25 [Opitutus sp.]|nr:50S ribosomal protein L25 [Opitutus sp.]
MSQKFQLNVTARAQTGRSASRRLRKANRVPAILYGKHTNPESLSVEGPEFTRLLKSVGGRAVLIELNRTDKGDKALSFLQEVQRDPITDKYVHVDLHEVKSDEKFEIRVPISIQGESFGVKNQSGVLEIASQTLRIRTLPKDLPEAIAIDVTELKVGEDDQGRQSQADRGRRVPRREGSAGCLVRRARGRNRVRRRRGHSGCWRRRSCCRRTRRRCSGRCCRSGRRQARREEVMFPSGRRSTPAALMFVL